MARYIALKNNNSIEPKFIVDEDIIIDKINTVELFDKFRELSFTEENIEYEVFNIVSENEYHNLWKMEHHNKHKENLEEMKREYLNKLSSGNGNICHACYVEITKNNEICFAGFANRGLFDTIEEKFLVYKTKRLNK